MFTPLFQNAGLPVFHMHLAKQHTFTFTSLIVPMELF